MTPALVTLLTGVILVLTSGCVGLHEILLGPEQSNYPNARRRVRAMMFAWAVALLYRGAEMLNGLNAPEPVYATFGTVVATVLLAAVQLLMLEQVLRQWLPSKLQRRVQQLIDVASCSRRREVAKERARQLRAVRTPVPPPPPPHVVGPALGDLMLDGWSVVGPGEAADTVEPPLHWMKP